MTGRDVTCRPGQVCAQHGLECADVLLFLTDKGVVSC